jgi:hypothetical protein
MSYLFDTNIFLRLTNKADPAHTLLPMTSQPHKSYNPTTRTRWLWVSAM